jgi:hypothetical protein
MGRSMRWAALCALLFTIGCGSCADSDVATGRATGAPGDQASAVPQYPSAEAGPQPLFVIRRSTNANVLHYDAQITADGKLNRDAPVVAYWIMLAEEGQREELTWMEREKAYGFTVEPAPGSDSYVMKLAPLPEREITVRIAGGAARAELAVDGRRAVLAEVYIESSAGLLGPKVQYIRLVGKDVQTDEERTEKIVPE